MPVFADGGRRSGRRHEQEIRDDMDVADTDRAVGSDAYDGRPHGRGSGYGGQCGAVRTDGRGSRAVTAGSVTAAPEGQALRPALEKFGFAELRRTAVIGSVLGGCVVRRVLRG